MVSKEHRPIYCAPSKSLQFLPGFLAEAVDFYGDAGTALALWPRPMQAGTKAVA
jgi:hypothetical protein